MFRAAIVLRDGLKGAKAWNPGTVLKKRGNREEVPVEDIHEVIRCRY